MSRKTRCGRRAAIAASASSASFAVRDAMAFVAENAGDQLSDVFFVVDDENVARHHAPLVSDESAPFAALDSSCGVSAERKDQAARRRRVPSGASSKFEPPAVILDNLGDNRQAEAGAVRARRHIRFEQALPVHRREALAIVDDVDLRHAVAHAET